MIDAWASAVIALAVAITLARVWCAAGMSKTYTLPDICRHFHTRDKGHP